MIISEKIQLFFLETKNRRTLHRLNIAQLCPNFRNPNRQLKAPVYLQVVFYSTSI